MSSFSLLKSGASFTKSQSNQKLLKMFDPKHKEQSLQGQGGSTGNNSWTSIKVDTEMEIADQEIAKLKEAIKALMAESETIKKEKADKIKSKITAQEASLKTW